jgi:large conductance mechanosensitive channel
MSSTSQSVSSSVVNGVIMPVVGILTSGHDFSDLALELGTDAKGTAVLLKYGIFVQAVVNFLIIAAVLFIAIKGINALKKPASAAAAEPLSPPRQEVLLEEIRNLLARSQPPGPAAQVVPSQSYGVKAS